MSEPYLAQLTMAGFNFPPRGWAQCDGQTLPINQNQSLYSLLGTTYGGDGRTTFKLPDLRGRHAIHKGAAPGGPNVNLGQATGSETATLALANLANHTHLFAPKVHSATDSEEAEERYFAGAEAGTYSSERNGSMAPVESGSTGNSTPFNIAQPYTAINYIMALQGLFPSRN